MSMPCPVFIIDDHAAPGERLGDFHVLKPVPELVHAMDAVILSTDYFQTTMKKQGEALWYDQVEYIDLYERFSWYAPDSSDL